MAVYSCHMLITYATEDQVSEGHSLSGCEEAVLQVLELMHKLARLG